MRKYNDEFKQNAVKKILDGQAVASVSRELGVAESLLQGWKTGAIVALIAAPISTAFSWIYHHYINPQSLEFLVDYEREKMLLSGLDASQMNARLNLLKAGDTDFAQIVGGLVGTIVMSLILSLIISLILRRKRSMSNSIEIN